ncbi:MAG: hypothetical protein PHO02_05070 [Candidatus Nanoarchaeia archaeon]|nr:hypothetical protein [Candidatus Nanoarchaeia archaeon]
MKKINAVLIILILAFTTIGIVSIAYNTMTTIGIRDIEMEARVGDKVGIAVDSEKLFFGMIFPGGSGSKKILISNEQEFPIAVKFVPIGQLKEYTSASENPALLQIGETKEIGITVQMPADMPYGNYTGIMRVITTKVRE